MVEDLPPREAFENQVYNALGASMRATAALWDVYSDLGIITSGGDPGWENIEEKMWEANEAIGFAQTYVQDDTGVVAQWRRLEEHHYQGPDTVPEEIEELPPAALMRYVQTLAKDDESALKPSDVATAASNLDAPMIDCAEE